MENYVSQIQSDMQKMFTDLRKGFDLQMEEASRFIKRYIPNLNDTEDDKNIYIKLKLAGVEPKDVNIHVENDALIVEGEKKEEKKTEREKTKILESAYGHFKRVIGLPDYVDVGKIEAVYKNGVLKITLPKKETQETSKKKIEIKTE